MPAGAMPVLGYDGVREVDPVRSRANLTGQFASVGEDLVLLTEAKK